MNYKESLRPASSQRGRVNVGRTERIVSLLAGGGLVAYGLGTRTKLGFVLGLLGSGLVYRGATGNCEAYRRLGINGSNTSEAEEIARDVHVERSITINRPPEVLYAFWRNFENLPRFMLNLESVTNLEGNRSHWVAAGPVHTTFEWDAEIYNDKENELIAWRSLPGSDVTNAGSVNFLKMPRGRGTCVKVTFNYNPPGGKPGVLLAKIFGLEPGQVVEENLKRLKQLAETGVFSTTEGQTSGRSQKTDSAGERESTPTIREAPKPGMAHEAKGGVV